MFRTLITGTATGFISNKGGSMFRNTPKNFVLVGVIEAVNQLIHSAPDYRTRIVWSIELTVLNEVLKRKAYRFDTALNAVSARLNEQIAELNNMPKSLEQQAALTFWNTARQAFFERLKTCNETFGR